MGTYNPSYESAYNPRGLASAVVNGVTSTLNLQVGLIGLSYLSVVPPFGGRESASGSAAPCCTCSQGELGV